MKIVLLTGASGFIGSHFADYLLERYPNYYLINLDALTYASNEVNYAHLMGHPRYRFIQGDICDAGLLREIFDTCSIEAVVHFAAESHVDNSIDSPSQFIQTNVMGTFALLEAACAAWMASPGQPRPGCAHCRFYHISTDEVYGSSDDGREFSESSPYCPSSPYSASKAASDHLVQAYHKTFGLNAVISNCSNNYGPRQHAEKLIPTIIRKALAEEPIPIYGNGTNVRDWLHVQDHCRAVDQILHHAEPGEQFNIGASSPLRNLELCHSICRILDDLAPRANGESYVHLISFTKDRPGHDLCYAISSQALRSRLGWKPVVPLEQGLLETVQWYLSEQRLAQEL